MMIQGREGQSYAELQNSVFAMMGAAQENPNVTQVYSTFNTNAPRIDVNVDRELAFQLGVQPADVYETLGAYMGSTYVNDFNFVGRTFRVLAQADAEFRNDVSDLAQLRVRSASGGMVPIPPSPRSRKLRARTRGASQPVPLHRASGPGCAGGLHRSGARLHGSAGRSDPARRGQL